MNKQNNTIWNTQKVEDQELAEMKASATTSTPRRDSSSSEILEKSSNTMTFLTNYYDSENASDSGTGTEAELHSNCERHQYLLREKEQTLFLALQDVQKLRSELERLSKSEQWYKQELKTQKTTRLAALERLYAQERKYMQENQRLQRECLRLYGKCSEMERELEAQRDKVMQELTKEAEINVELEEGLQCSRDFEIEQQRALINDQRQLIDVLRKQKRALLEDLKRLSEEKDERVLELQQTLATVEIENTRITSKCKRLLDERKSLEERLKLTESELQVRDEHKQTPSEPQEQQILRDDRQNSAEVNADIELLSKENEKLLQNLDAQNQLIIEKEKLLSDLENHLEHKTQLKEHTTFLTENLKNAKQNAELLANENMQLKAQLNESKKYELINKETCKDLAEKAQECSNLKKQLLIENEKMKNIQQSLHDKEKVLLKNQEEQKSACEQIEQLKKDNENLLRELSNAQELNTSKEIELQETKEVANQLQASLENAEANKGKESESLKLIENESEILSLIKQNTSLHEKLRTYFTENTKTKSQDLRQENDGIEQENTLELCTNSVEKLIEKSHLAEENKLLECTPEAKVLSVLYQENNEQELYNLRIKLQDLEEQLRSSISADEGKRSERITLINKLLEQQGDRVAQLNQSQIEWEELLQALNATQSLEENHKRELEFKRAELEELNELFAEQNEELKQLQEFSLQLEYKRKTDYKELKESFQQQLQEIEANFSAKLCERNEQQTKQFAELTNENESLKRHLNEDYASEVAQTNTKLRSMQARIEKLLEERTINALRMQEMQQEITEYRQSKRAAVVVPELILFRRESEMDDSAQIDYETKSSSSAESSRYLTLQPQVNVMDDVRMRILTKVLESEYRRKMKRYDLHIRTLLTNVKSLKKALKAAEHKATAMSEAQAKNMQDLENLQMTKRHLEEMRLKVEQSQGTIKTLEQALQMERKKFEASDFGKFTQQELQEPTHEVPNLIDDYKKLIQQTAVETRRPKTSAILELIQRSNQCVPNLNKLETTVDELRSDIQEFIVNYTQGIMMDSVGAMRATKMPSLMSELRAATEHL